MLFPHTGNFAPHWVTIEEVILNAADNLAMHYHPTKGEGEL